MTRKWTLGAVSFAALLFLILGQSAILRPQDESPDAPDLSLVQANRQRGRFVQALYQLDVVADQAGWSADRLQLAGDIWRDLGDLTRALPYWEAASLQQPDDRLLRRVLAEAYLTMQRWPDAVDQLTGLIQADANDAWAHFQVGMLRAAFDPQAAEVDLQAAVNVPDYHDLAAALHRIVTEQNTDPLIGMPVGLALADAGYWPQAELAFRHAADVAQAYPEALAYVGLAREQQGKDGSDWIKRAVALGPRSAAVRYVQGLHLRSRNDLDGSLKALLQAVVLDPVNPAYYAELGTAYKLVGDLDNAERWLRVGVETSNQDPRFQRLLALFYAEEVPNLESGLSDLQVLATVMPDDPDVQAGVAWGVYQSGDPDAALAALDAILQADPAHPRSLFYKARILLEAGNLDGAEPLLEQLVGLDSPFQADSQRLLDGLEAAR
ncbi:MAG: tetratricopeptide repeat protein [Anaerolineae bacterium]|nr:tetratricopeptide repeat protein [Anaerolineae bacterium]